MIPLTGPSRTKRSMRLVTSRIWTAQLEAMAIAARLDLLAYFLGMAKAEKRICVRTNAVAEVERSDEEQHFDIAVGFPHGNDSFD